jgi:hypothetical protein
MTTESNLVPFPQTGITNETGPGKYALRTLRFSAASA